MNEASENVFGFRVRLNAGILELGFELGCWTVLWQVIRSLTCRLSAYGLYQSLPTFLYQLYVKFNLLFVGANKSATLPNTANFILFCSCMFSAYGIGKT